MNSEKDSSRLSNLIAHLKNIKDVRRSEINNTNIGLDGNIFKGTESARKLPVNDEDFSLPQDDHIAAYDRSRLVKEWNRNEVTHKLLAKLYRGFIYGLPRRISPVVLYFLVMFYSVQFLRLRYGCVEPGSKSDSIREKMMIDDFEKEPKPKIDSNDDENVGNTGDKKCYGPDPFEFGGCGYTKIVSKNLRQGRFRADSACH